MIREYKGVYLHYCDNCTQKINRSKTEGHRWNHCRVCTYEDPPPFTGIQEFCSQSCSILHSEDLHSSVNLV